MGLHADGHPCAGMVVHACGVAAARIFVSDVVAYGTIFVDQFIGAAANGLVAWLAIAAFDHIANQPTGNGAHDGGGCAVGARMAVVAVVSIAPMATIAAVAVATVS